MAKTANLHTICTLQLSSKNQKPNENKFEVTVIEAIDESLGAFKNLNKQEIYSHLENRFGIKKQEIPSKIEDFADAMEQMFGIGAKLIEIRIIEALYERNQDFVHFPKKGELAFTEYVDDLRSFLRPQTF